MRSPPPVTPLSPHLPRSPYISRHIIPSDHCQLIVKSSSSPGRPTVFIIRMAFVAQPPPPCRPPSCPSPLTSLAWPSIACRASAVCHHCWLIVIFIRLPPANHHLLCWVDTLVCQVLLFVKYLHAHIASGFDDPGHRNKKATVCAMQLPLRTTLPDMFGKI